MMYIILIVHGNNSAQTVSINSFTILISDKFLCVFKVFYTIVAVNYYIVPRNVPHNFLYYVLM